MDPGHNLQVPRQRQRFLDPGVAIGPIDATAHAVSDLAPAHALGAARDALRRAIGRPSDRSVLQEPLHPQDARG